MGLGQISGWEFWCFPIDFLFVNHKVSFIDSKKSTFLRGVHTYVHTCVHLQKHPGPSMSEYSHFHRDTRSNVLIHAPNTCTHALLTLKWIQFPSTSDPETLMVSSQPALRVRGRHVLISPSHSVYLTQGCPGIPFFRSSFGSILGATAIVGVKGSHAENWIRTLGKWPALSEPQFFWL